MDDLEHRRVTRHRTELLGACRAWLENSHSPERADDLAAAAETFLDWDVDYSGASLTLFDRDDVDEYLLEWCPRKLSFPPESWLGVLDGLVAYLEFLGESGNWRGLAAQAGAVAKHARSQTQAFLDAMADPSKYGMAKSMFMGPAFAGADIDFEDPASLQAAMERFNNLPFEERRALTDPALGRSPADDERTARRARATFDMPPVRLPSPEAVAASATASPLLRVVDGLREYLGEKGVALTATDNLKLADCRALVERLGTGDTFEYGPPGATSQARSMNELPTLALVFDIALEAGATRKVKGRLLAVKRWKSEPVLSATELAGVALEFVTGGMNPWLDDVAEIVAGGLPYLLAPAMGFGIALQIEEMLPIAIAAVDGVGGPRWATPETTQRVVEHALRDLMERAALAGIITFADDEVSMTPFGVRFMVDRMREQGYVVPELPSLASLSADELLASIEDATVFVAPLAWPDWQPTWTDAQKCRALVDALLGSPYELRSAHQRHAAFALLEVPATSDVEPELRRLLGGPYAGYALTGLSVREAETPADLDTADPEDLEGVVDLLGVTLPWVDECYLTLTVDGAVGVVEEARELFEDTATAMLEFMATMPIAEAGDVLEAIGKAHPDKAVAKLARTALHKWRSRWSR